MRGTRSLTERVGAESTEPSLCRMERKSISSPSLCSGNLPVRRAKLRMSLLLLSKGSTPHRLLAAASPRFASCLS